MLGTQTASHSLGFIYLDNGTPQFLPSLSQAKNVRISPRDSSRSNCFKSPGDDCFKRSPLPLRPSPSQQMSLSSNLLGPRLFGRSFFILPLPLPAFPRQASIPAPGCRFHFLLPPLGPHFIKNFFSFL